MKVLAIGDIHTKTWMLYEIADIIDQYDAVVFVGDYADNWNTPPTQSIATWRLLKNLCQEDNVNAVIGNHDYAYIHPEIAGRSSGWNPVTFTLLNTPEKKEVKEWLLDLPITLEIDGVTYSHAGITEAWNGEEDVASLWNDDSPIWARPRQMGGRHPYKQITQVIGHNPSKEIWQPEPGIWCIDTFSEYQDNRHIGDCTVLEIIDGKEFNIKTLDEVKSDAEETNSDNKSEDGFMS